jgi:hypothetical protein
MEKSFVFYNRKLFSGDDDSTHVEDPVQQWSHRFDPYLDRRAH